MAELEQLRSRPDYYILKWRKKTHHETLKAKAETVKLHDSFFPKVKRIAKSDQNASQKSRAFVALGENFHDQFELLLQTRVNRVQRSSAEEAQGIVNLMLPQGVLPPGQVSVTDYWGREYKGRTPTERLAVARIKTRKRMASIMAQSFREVAKAPLLLHLAADVWGSTSSECLSLAGNEPWLGGLLGLAQTFESNAEVISHFEHLATLDMLTCEECGALDGSIIDIGILGEDVEPDVTQHSNCRCVAIPVTKTWEELGLPGVDDPEGTRIARTGYPLVDEMTGDKDWGRSAPGIDSNQGYVPSGTRYSEWRKKNAA